MSDLSFPCHNFDISNKCKIHFCDPRQTTKIFQMMSDDEEIVLGVFFEGQKNAFFICSRSQTFGMESTQNGYCVRIHDIREHQKNAFFRPRQSRIFSL